MQIVNCEIKCYKPARAFSFIFLVTSWFLVYQKIETIISDWKTN